MLDDSDEPSPFFTRLDDPRVHYTHSRERLSTGAKRNRLIEQAQGEWICHFDDDDFYADGYVAHLHDSNVSHVFPQYRLPSFMLAALFPGHARYERRLGS